MSKVENGRNKLQNDNDMYTVGTVPTVLRLIYLFVVTSTF